MKTDYRSLVERDGLGQWDLEGRGDAIVQIERIEKYVPPVKRQKKIDGVMVEERNTRIKVWFVGKRKYWLAGPVSQKVLKGMFGKYVEDWIGKRITLYVDPTVTFGRETTGGIRVRPTPPKLGTPTTGRTLDQPVDAAKSEQLERAREQADKGARREPGEEG